MRQRIFQIVGPAREGDIASRAYDFFVVFVAILSLVPMLFDYSKLDPFWIGFLEDLDVVTAYILIVDYVFRWMTHDFRSGKGWKSFLYYPITPIAVIDILAILPSLGIVSDSFLFFRLFRIIKVFRYSKNLVIITNACSREAKTLGSVFLAAVVYILTVALVVYTSEPQAFVNFFDAICWAATQITTVSFSDSRPESYIAVVLSIASALVAVLIVALPAGIVTGSYINELRLSKEKGSIYYWAMLPNRNKLSDLDRPSVWLSKNAKVVRYLAVIISNVLLTIAVSIALELLGFFPTTIILGTALCAYLLEPAAGIVAGMILCAAGAIVYNEPFEALYIFEYVLVSLVFGFIVPKPDSKHFVQRILAAALLLSVGNALIDCILAFIASGYSVDTFLAFQFERISMTGMLLADFNVGPLFAVIVGTIESFGLDLIFESVIFTVIVFKFGAKTKPSEKEQVQQLLLHPQCESGIETPGTNLERNAAIDMLQEELRTLTERKLKTQEKIDETNKKLATLLNAEERAD